MTYRQPSNPDEMLTRASLGRAALLVTLLLLGFASIATLLSTFALGSPASVQAASSAPTALSVSGVEPETAPNDIDAPIVIAGTGFAVELSGTLVLTAPTAYLGGAPLADITWVNSTTLSATVPWGLETGPHDLTVVNPDGVSATLATAFSVTQGIGVWTAGGPYGGIITQLATKPGTPETVYAVVWGVGTFISEDGGGSWVPVHDHDRTLRLVFDAVTAEILYVGADSNALYRSDDEGGSWVRLTEGFHTEEGCFSAYPAAHPAQAGAIYFGMGSCGGGINLLPDEGGVFYSTDYGATWITRSVGLTDTDVQALAIHPANPDMLLAGTLDGNLFVSEDSGLSWSWTAQLTQTINHLYFNPYESMQAWATATDESGVNGSVFRSLDLTVWEPIPLALPDGAGSSEMLAFRPGEVWCAAYDLLVSADGGDTWTDTASFTGWARAIALQEDNPQTMYAGTDRAVHASTDGGATWQDVTEGLAGLVPDAVAVSPTEPETVYVHTSLGLFATDSAGEAWRDLDFASGGFVGQGQLAVDAFDPDRVYFGYDICQDAFCIDVSPDRGNSWSLVAEPLPPTYDGWSSSAGVVASSPYTTGRLLAAALVWPADGFPWSDSAAGIIYGSDDHGLSWSHLGPSQVISPVTQLVYGGDDPDRVYAGTAGSGLWRSDDGGVSWAHVPIADLLPPVGIGSIAVHPEDSDRVYLRAYSSAETSNPPPQLLKSSDGGANWESMADLDTGVGLAIFPPLPGSGPYVLYSGCPDNLCRSADDGQTWDVVVGTTRPEILVTATDGERAFLYLGTPGGLLSSAEAAARPAYLLEIIPGRGSILGGGVYRLTTELPSSWVYMPAIARW